MDFIEKMIMLFGAKKAVESLTNPTEKTQSPKWFSRATYAYLRHTYFSNEDLSDSLLDELFRREPDLIDGECDPDCREYLNLNIKRYEYKGRTVCGETWFTISVNNRFMCNAFLDGLIDDNLRNYELIDFSQNLFSAVGNPSAHSISIGDYVIYFDAPFFYNLTLMLLQHSDRQFYNSPSISSRATSLPPIVITDELFEQYGISYSESSNEGVTLHNASYAVLTDFNSENNYERGNGTITIRVVDGKRTKSDDFTPCTIRDLLLQQNDVKNGTIWLSIAPSPVQGPIYLLGTQFNFLDTSEGVIVRGDPTTCELYICRTNDGWGGIKFKFQNKRDYYRAAIWLIPAVSMYCEGAKGWDYKQSITKYWPTYPFSNF